ncbi:hypothetical protein SAMN05192561_102123 [Halopenitus malekzadehii]|uniref:Uncharacterized protein n=1 Tax=Halopenitus malekzadehii TaxID=1267564 RepID=A0A1H6IBT9_9EURY|nr:hypothetical protein [Halopenitus malekzadehii]SEH46140.1 hypothetical protein SAMN05192561_102123 [Halopenitus malekzadehii]
MSIPHARLPADLTLHVGDEESLLERLRDGSPGTELVLTPVELHRRNVQRRLREAHAPKDGIEFADPADVGVRLLGHADGLGPSTDCIDRIDRLSMVRSIHTDGSGSSIGPGAPEEPRAIEQLRTEIENVTGFHPARLRRLRDAAGTIDAPIDADARERIDAAVDIERSLRERTDSHVSDVALVRRAIRTLRDTDGTAWRSAFPDVTCVSFVGVSSVSAVYVDLLHVLLDRASVETHLHLRRGTGPYLARRLPDLFDVDAPGAVVFEP